MDSRQEEQTGSREIVNREAWQNRQSEGNKAASRLFTASPTIRGACGLPFGTLSQLLLKTGLLRNAGAANSRVAKGISAPVCSFLESQYIPT